MAKLEIEVKHSGGGGSGSAAGRGAFTAQDAEQIKRSLEQANRLSVVLLKGAKDFRAEFGAAAKGLDTGLATAAANSDRNASRMALGFQRSLEQAGRLGGEKFGVEAGKAAEKSFRTNFRPFAAGIGVGAATQLAPAFSRFGVEASSAFGVAFQGGLNGNLIRGAGGLGGATARLGGAIGKSLATAAGAGFNLIPVLGPALKGVSTVIGAAFSVAGSLAGTILNAAGEVAGAFGDALGTALKVAVGTAAVVGIAGLRLALKESDLAPSFERIAKASGETTPKALEKLRTATRGTVSDLDLMRLANQSVALGAAQTIPNIERLAGVSVSLARIVGRDATDAFNRLVLGIGKAEPELLDELAIKIRLTDVTKAYGESIGKAALDLTAAERTQAVLNATLTEAERVIAKGGKAASTSGELFRQFKVSIENAGLAIGRTLLPVIDKLSPPLTRVTDAMTRFVERSASIDGTGFDNFAKTVERGSKIIADFFDRATFDDFKLLAVNAFDTAAIYGKAAMGGLFDYLSLRAKQAAEELKAIGIENAVALGFATGGAAGALAGAGLKVKEHYAAGGDTIDGGRNAGVDAANARAAAFGQQASQVSFSPNSDDVGRLNQLSVSRAAQVAGVLARPAAGGADSRPSSRPTVARSNQEPDRVPFQSVSVPSFSLQPQANILGQTLAGSGSSASSIAQIVPYLEQVGAALAAAGKTADDVARAAQEFSSKDIVAQAADFGDALTAPMEKSVDIWEENLRQANDLVSEQQDKIADSRKAIERLGDALADGLDDIADAFTQDRDQILARRDQRVAAANQRTAGLKDQLIGQAGGIGPDESAIPAKLRRAAKKARKNANKERRDSLRNLSDGLSTDELAANGASLLQNVFEEQAAKETNRTGEIQAAYAAAAQAIRELENDRIAAELELKATIEESAREQIALMKDSNEVLKGLTKSRDADLRTLQEIRADLEKIKATIKQTEDLARRAAR